MIVVGKFVVGLVELGVKVRRLSVVEEGGRDWGIEGWVVEGDEGTTILRGNVEREMELGGGWGR